GRAGGGRGVRGVTGGGGGLGARAGAGAATGDAHLGAGLRADDAVGGEAVLALVALHGLLGRGPEGAVGADADLVLDLLDDAARVALLDDIVEGRRVAGALGATRRGLALGLRRTFGPTLGGGARGGHRGGAEAQGSGCKDAGARARGRGAGGALRCMARGVEHAHVCLLTPAELAVGLG